MREALVKASLREKPFREARNEVSLKKTKKQARQEVALARERGGQESEARGDVRHVS